VRGERFALQLGYVYEEAVVDSLSSMYMKQKKMFDYVISRSMLPILT
jgi:hypothetical protein